MSILSAGGHISVENLQYMLTLLGRVSVDSPWAPAFGGEKYTNAEAQPSSEASFWLS